ncbi:hypothetical protein ABFU82_11920 [Nocardioides sp. WV_118_6]
MTAPNPLETLEALQAQALTAIQTGQSATLDAIKRWSEGFAQFTATLPPAPEAPAVPGVPDDLKAAFGEPAEILDSVYDFAAKLLELNKEFAHQLLAAGRPPA